MNLHLYLNEISIILRKREIDQVDSNLYIANKTRNKKSYFDQYQKTIADL